MNIKIEILYKILKEELSTKLNNEHSWYALLDVKHIKEQITSLAVAAYNNVLIHSIVRNNIVLTLLVH